DLDPKRYTLRSVPALLARTKAWDGYDDAASSIKAAIRKLAAKSSALRPAADSERRARRKPSARMS
ncbi:MAG: hypothetical protein ACJ8EK_14320, partial [Bradyrhizobium sp.]